MKTLVLGASGATGKLVVSQLIKRKIKAKIVVRETAIMPAEITDNKNIETVKGNIDAFNKDSIRELMLDCDSVICCLGHNISIKGMFGGPYKLVVNSVKKVTDAMMTIHEPKKLILMSTTAYTNKKNGEENTFGEKLVFSLLEILLPPHKDNMLAGDHLVYEVGASSEVEWVALRPDTLIDEKHESDSVVS